ncbi:signal peptidase I [Erythrobacter sp. Alg231-14]|uniref:signal peptidase I n=1 Tax=Erythrobacter sp. Alg231-14 TaxID=1922225 RepID=UPI000D561CE9
MNVKTQSLSPSPASPDNAPNTGAGPDESGEQKESFASFLWFLFKLLLAVLIFRSFIFSPFSIPSESMLPRLWNGDYLLAAKWPYGFSSYSLPYSAPLIPGRVLATQPDRGDVVIFKHPIDKTDYVKRVIGLPGDSIAMVEGRILLNGEMIEREAIDDFEIPLSINTSCAWGGQEATNDAGEQVCRYTQFRETIPVDGSSNGRQYTVLDFGNTPADSFAPTVIPEGHMFVLGDNRDNSRDSRFEARSGDAVGIVPQANLVGEATIIMWSTDGSAEWIKPWTWFTAARWSRIGNGL